MAVDLTPTLDKGVLKEILVEGVENEYPPLGSKVKVHYTGTLEDGTKFDSSRDRNDPFEFDLGKGSVIKAWDLGVASMKKGERAMLTCAADYAYGKSGSPPTIPPGATLKFDVEVISWKLEDISPNSDGSILRAIKVAGTGQSTPNEGAIVEVQLLGQYNEKTFDDRELTYTVGEGAEFDIVEGVDISIDKFKKGECSTLTIKPQYAFGQKGSEKFSIPPNATVQYTVTLKSFEKTKENWAMDSKERVEHAKLFKEKGSKYFSQEKYPLAIKMYKKVLEILESQQDSETRDDYFSLRVAANSNLSLCYLRTGDNFEAKASATAALNEDDLNVKAFFRRGQALLNLGEADLASSDFAECLRLDPANAAAKKQHEVCAKTLKTQLAREKQIYANMFDKFAKMDAQREEIEKKKEPNVMSSVGEWGKEDREREPSEFEKENPNILLLNNTGEFKDM